MSNPTEETTHFGGNSLIHLSKKSPTWRWPLALVSALGLGDEPKRRREDSLT